MLRIARCADPDEAAAPSAAGCSCRICPGEARRPPVAVRDRWTCWRHAFQPRPSSAFEWMRLAARDVRRFRRDAAARFYSKEHWISSPRSQRSGSPSPRFARRHPCPRSAGARGTPRNRPHGRTSGHR
ncbi:MAG: hypothetical protein Q6373_007545 [Candidatus Sigynarchaeota archaeon]